MKRLYFDIETSPNIVLSWRVGNKIKIDHDNIIQERKIICVGYKWAHKKRASVITWDCIQDDKSMLEKMSEIMTDADEVVTHNGDKFDIPWLKTRFAFHRIPPPPNIKSIDTLQWAKRRMLFNSNKLDYIAGYLGFGRKLKTEFGLWKDVLMKKDPSALKKMSRYCARDVELLQKVHEAIEPYSGVVKTHAAVNNGGPRWACPYSGSENVNKRGTDISATGVVRYKMHCRDNGRWYRISEAAHREYQEHMQSKKEEQTTTEILR